MTPRVSDSAVPRFHFSDLLNCVTEWKRNVPEQRARGWRKGHLLIRHVSRLACVVLVAGCGHWEQRRLYQPTPVKAGDPVWIWSGGTVEKWHAVVITSDSVSGIPYATSIKCDSCRRSIPWAQVDSMTLEYKTGAASARDVAKASLLLAGGIAALLLLELVVCYAAGSPNGC